ncbi:uncharacterized protein LOC134240847 [Saccostrea cucullata]|uniref:uncharacterized protein LOC134240847 n=1 Tax=Saccostrea cuccullata TaxID=36930 RepID=UPI002ED54196
MNPKFCAQDMIRCGFCKDRVVQMYCNFCYMNLCKICMVEQTSDKSKKHEVVPYDSRKSYHVFSLETPEGVYCPPEKPLLDEPEVIATKNTGYILRGVTCLSDDEVWTCGQDKIMKLYNLQGKLLKSIQTKSGKWPGDITVTESGDLIYTDPDTKTVNIVKNKQIQEVIRLQAWRPYLVLSVIHWSSLISIQFDSEGKPLYSSGYLKYVSENRNLDICVADQEAKAIVVDNLAGKFRFRYTGNPSATKGSFDPLGITTDSQSQILTADCFNHSIHILDQDGQFLCYIDNCDLKKPMGICIDTRDNLFVACHCGKVKIIKYM